jgi:hypothetical protein
MPVSPVDNQMVPLSIEIENRGVSPEIPFVNFLEIFNLFSAALITQRLISTLIRLMTFQLEDA